jgi:hypothetical protein
MDAERCQIEALRAAVQAAELSPRPSQPEVPAAIRDALSLAAQVAREREARRRNAARPLTVDEWLARRPVACWVLRVDEPMPHWLVARRGFVVAGDLPECGSARVVEAWRCFPLSGVWRGKISRG